MTIQRNVLGMATVLVMGLGAMSAPAMAAVRYTIPDTKPTQAGEYRTPSGKECSIGETYNGGSISSDSVSDDEIRHRRDNNPNDCGDVGR